MAIVEKTFIWFANALVTISMKYNDSTGAVTAYIVDNQSDQPVSFNFKTATSQGVSIPTPGHTLKNQNIAGLYLEQVDGEWFIPTGTILGGRWPDP